MNCFGSSSEDKITWMTISWWNIIAQWIFAWNTFSYESEYSVNKTSASNYNDFIIAFDKNNGDYSWAHSLYTTWSETSWLYWITYSIQSDSNNIYLWWIFNWEEVHFNWASLSNKTPGSIPLNNRFDWFIYKLDSQWNVTASKVLWWSGEDHVKWIVLWDDNLYVFAIPWSWTATIWTDSIPWYTWWWEAPHVLLKLDKNDLSLKWSNRFIEDSTLFTHDYASWSFDNWKIYFPYKINWEWVPDWKWWTLSFLWWDSDSLFYVFSWTNLELIDSEKVSTTVNDSMNSVSINNKNWDIVSSVWYWSSWYFLVWNDKMNWKYFSSLNWTGDQLFTDTHFSSKWELFVTWYFHYTQYWFAWNRYNWANKWYRVWILIKHKE